MSVKTAYEKLPRYLRRFVDMRVQGIRPTHAAREIRPKAKRHDQIAWIWNQREDVRAAFEQRCAEAEQEAGITAARVMAETANVAFGDIRLLFDENGNLRPLHELPAEVAAQLAGVDVEELFEGSGKERSQIGVVRKVKRWDKVKALELLGKRLKLWTDRAELELGNKTLEQLVGASMQKPASPT